MAFRRSGVRIPLAPPSPGHHAASDAPALLFVDTTPLRFPRGTPTKETSAMKNSISSVCAMFSAIALGVTALSVRAADAPWKQLFNERNFDGWDKFLATPNGDQPLVANVDPKSVFSVTNLNGENVIHVTGEVYGAITTREEFTNFHFRVQFQWGRQRWPGRENVGRDSGILYCGIGQPNPHTGWLISVENNIMEKGIGQWWSVNGAIIDVEGEWITPELEPHIPYQKESAGEKNIVYREGAPRITATPANGITPNFEAEKPFGEWNSVEVVFWGGNCIHLLNGRVNMVLVNPCYEEAGQWRPLSRGKIQLQSEAAEVFYRNVEVRPLYELPAEFLNEIPSPVADEQGFIPLLTRETLKGWKQCGPGRFIVENGVATADGGMGL